MSSIKIHELRSKIYLNFELREFKFENYFWETIFFKSIMDDGALIQQVFKFSALYNKNDGRFKNKAFKDQAWETISKILQYPAKLCEQRWCVLRNRYTGLKRKMRTTPPELGTLTITWPYYDMMKFLDPFLTTRRSRTVDHIIIPPRVSSEEIVETALSEYSESENEQEEEEFLMETATNNEMDGIDKKNCILFQTNQQTHHESYQNPKTNSVHANVGRMVDDPLLTHNHESYKKPKTNNVHANVGQMADDPLLTHNHDDQHFVKSLVSDMSIFSKEERILLKRKFYNVMADFLEEKLKKTQ